MLASTSLTRKTGAGAPKLFVEDSAIVPSAKQNTSNEPAGRQLSPLRNPKPTLYYHPIVTSRLGRWLSDPAILLCLAAGLLAFVVQSGELGTADTMHRLQTTHWLWTSEPQVFPTDYPEFGLRGRGGRLYSWYGIGQSLLMLPADLAGTWIAHWQLFSDYDDDPAVRSIVVSYSTSILLNVLTALIAFRLLRQLRFSVRESVLGVLTLMFCT